MKHFNTSSLTLKNLWTIFLITAIPLISVCGASLVPYMIRTPLIYATGIIFLFLFVFSDMRVSMNLPNFLFFLLISYIALSISFSLDKQTTVNLLLIYLCSFSMLFIDFPESCISKIFKIFYVITIVIAFSIIISVPIKECMNKYFWFIVNPTRAAKTAAAISQELSFGAYSGFAREMGEAAFIMNVGLAVSFSKYFLKGKLNFKELFFTLVQMTALILTGKRTYFLASVFCFIVGIFLSQMKGKAFKILSFLLIGTFSVFVILMFIPEMANIFNKLLDQENIENLGGRSSLWPYIFAMIKSYWLFGAGFGSYNQYAYHSGLRVNGTMWNYNAHNSYLQILGELGIIGLTLLILFIACSLYITIKLIKNPKNLSAEGVSHLFFSLYIQIMFIIYAATGNPLYTKQIVFVWLFAIGISLSIMRQLNKSEQNLLCNHIDRSIGYGK